MRKDTGQSLDEITRIELLDRVKVDDRQRMARRLTISDYQIKYFPIDTSLFYNQDRLLFEFKVKDYRVSIEVDGILGYMRKHIKDRRINYTTIRRLLSRSIDRSQIRINCTCPDFRYRYAYTATQGKFKEGEDETRPSNITNPDRHGGACKHILRMLNNKRWIYKYVSLINVLVKLNPSVVRGQE